MYILEVLFKYFKKKSKSNNLTNNNEIPNYEKCDHIFLPIDSTKKTLACNKCGLVIKTQDEEKKRNFFDR